MKGHRIENLLVILAALVFGACSISEGNDPELNVVVYDRNNATSGTVPFDGNEYARGDTVTVLGNTGSLARVGYVYSGWNTAADGSADTYTQGAKFSMGTSTMHLYARWILNSIPTFTVTYNANGATGGSVPADTTNYEAGQTVTVLGNTGNLVKTDYNSSGWNTAADGSGTDREAGTTFTMGTADVTLYVKWTAFVAAATPTFSPSGGIYTSDQSVTISCATSGATIYYTTDGSTPTTSSTQYTGAITATASGSGTTINAIATAPGYSTSSVGSATYREFAVGDTGPAGGVVFYDKGSYSSGWRWLEAAPSDQSSGVQWYNGSYVDTGATATDIGSGASNTAAIVSVQGPGTYAASICADLSLGGYDDWFLPSMAELDVMYGQRAVIGGFASAFYWSSSANAFNNALILNFGFGDWYIYGTEDNDRVRAIRAF